jgi:serine/threonine protein kinase
MEWIEGKNLEYFKTNRIQCKFNDELDFIRMVLILSQQVRYLHSKSIIHGDIKTKNIMFIGCGKIF